MKISTFSVLVGIIIMSSVLITTGEYFNDQLLEDYENLSILDYGNYSDSSGYNYNETEFDDLSSQLESNPILSAIGFVFQTFKDIFFGIPDYIGDILTSFGYPIALVTSIYAGLVAVFSIIYILFILQVISYLMGGGE